jgi:hypothetical protein
MPAAARPRPDFTAIQAPGRGHTSLANKRPKLAGRNANGSCSL